MSGIFYLVKTPGGWPEKEKCTMATSRFGQSLLAFLALGLSAVATDSRAAGPVIGWGYEDGITRPPASVSGETGKATAVDTEGYYASPFACAIKKVEGNAEEETSAVVCWGRDSFGRIFPPASVNGEEGGAIAVSVGSDYACAIREVDNAVVCWGNSALGKTTVPESVNGTQGYASAIDAGVNHACAIQQGSGHVFCWGRDTAGETIPPAGVTAPDGGRLLSRSGATSVALSSRIPMRPAMQAQWFAGVQTFTT